MVELSAITPGLSATTHYQVDKASTAGRVGSGSVDVLSTPELVRLMEMTAVAALADHLPPGFTTVGAAISVKHLAPTPVGLNVTVDATLSEVQGRQLKFDIVARDDVEEIGHATHQRVVISLENFMARANRKLDQ